MERVNYTQDPKLTFEELYDQAKNSIDQYAISCERYLRELQKKYPGKLDDVKFQLGKIKSFERSMDKIKGDYDGEVFKIVDIVRGRYIAKTVEQVYLLKKELKNTHELNIVRFKDRFAEPTDLGFRAYYANIKIKGTGHIAELRIEHESFLKTAKTTHDMYKQMQEIERGDEKYKKKHKLKPLENKSISAHLEAARQSNLDLLLNAKGIKIVLNLMSKSEKYYNSIINNLTNFSANRIIYNMMKKNDKKYIYDFKEAVKKNSKHKKIVNER